MSEINKHFLGIYYDNHALWSLALSMIIIYYHLGFDRKSESNDKDKQVVVCDINSHMLEVGKQRVSSMIGKENNSLIGFVEGIIVLLDFIREWSQLCIHVF